MKKEVYVGTYPFGTISVELYAMPNSADGNLSFFPHGELKHRARIRVGVGGTWLDAVDRLLHETLEMAFILVNARYAPAPDYSKSQANYMFCMNHEQFADAASRAAQFLDHAVVELSRAYKKRGKKKSKKAR